MQARSHRLVLFASLVALLAGLPASAGAADFSIFGSYFDTDDFDEAAGFGLRLAFFEGTTQLEITASYYDQFGSNFDLSLLDLELDVVKLELDVIPIDVGARFNVGESPLYFGVGGTYFSLDGDGGDVDDEYGFYGKVGGQWEHFFAEVGFRDVEGTVKDIGFGELITTDRTDFDLSGWFVNAGWRF